MSDQIRMLFRVRGHGSPQGKARVYFTCHPGDAASCFEKTVTDLLRMINCAVWYREEHSMYFRDEEELEDLLGQMQLFVIPVTTRLLTAPSAAMDQEYPYALRHHIPVLPLMMEEGIDDLFRRRFGDIQYLAPNRKDPTAISYQDKLSRYLKSTLVGDELAESIRETFDAYIFLSYRKKDRRSALELMQRIHQNENCERIAIWYDEYLVPTEDFNAAIQDALEKSSLFTLVVTPNLVNEPNYVMNVEYPAACQAGMKILPVEVQLTDRHLLENCYRGIPACVSGRDGQRLGRALEEGLKDVNLAENKENAEHNYLIGLAYLEGIDVEVDHRKALKLITDAANRGHPDAISQLAVMYEEGKGVSRDLDTSLAWRKKLVDNLWNVGSLLAGVIGDAVIDYAQALSRCGRYTEALQNVRRLLEMAEGLPRSSEDRQNLLVRGYMLASELSSELGQYDDGERALIRAAEERFGGPLSETHFAPDDAPFLYRYYIALAAGTFRKGEYSETLDYYLLAESAAQEAYMSGLTTQEDYQTNQAYLALQFGDIYSHQHLYRDARKQVLKARDIYVQLAAEYEADGYRQSQILCCITLGDIETGLRNSREAYSLYETALRLSNQLYEETESLYALNSIAESYRFLGFTCIATGRTNQARRLAEEFRRRMVTVYQSVDSKTCKENFARVYLLTAMIDAAEEKWSSSDSRLQFAERIARKNAEAFPEDYDAAMLLETVIGARGYALFNLGKYEEAKACYHEAMAIINTMGRKTADPLAPANEESVIRERLGHLYLKTEDPDAAEREFRKVLSLRRKLATRYDSAEGMDGLWQIQQSLGDIACERERYDEARRYYSAGMKSAQSLVTRSDNPQDMRALFCLQERYGLLMNQMENRQEAMRNFQRALEIGLSILRTSDQAVNVSDVCHAYHHIGFLHFQEDRLPDALTCFQKELSLAQSVQNRYPESSELRGAMSAACYMLAACFSAQGNYPWAEHYVMDLLRLEKSMAEKDRTPSARLSLLDAYEMLIRVCSESGQIGKAAPYQREMLLLAEQISAQGSSLEQKSALYRACLCIGDAAYQADRNSEALLLYRKAAGALKGLLRSYPESSLFHTLAQTLYCIGDILLQQQCSDEALQSYQEAISCAERVQADSIAEDDLLRLACLYADCADLLTDRGNFFGARRYYQRAGLIAKRIHQSEELRSEARLLAERCSDILSGG